MGRGGAKCLRGAAGAGAHRWRCVETSAQSSHKKKKKVKKPPAVPCRVGCKPDTATQGLVAGDTPEDQALRKELSGLAREVHNAAPGAYNNLSAFAAKNAANVWGARAALALGFEDQSQGHAQQAFAWFTKASADTLLREYVLYWTAQAKRALGRSNEALADLETIQHDYPNTAMKEQLLESLAPLAVEQGRAQDAIDALNSYSATGSRPTLLLERAQAYQSLHQLDRAAKDYQAIFYKHSQSDEAKVTDAALKKILHEMGKEYPYPGVELQQQRAQAFYDAHKWKEARAEFEKLLGMLNDPHESQSPTGRASRRASPNAAEGFAETCRGAEDAGCRSRCGTPLCALAILSPREKVRRNVRDTRTSLRRNIR